MYPIVRVNKRIPDGSIWQRYRAYRLPDLHGAARVYGPPGTGWWNPVGGWQTQHRGVSLFHPSARGLVEPRAPAGRPYPRLL